ncbi:site-specific tyrosine recombinase XerD [Halosquirtibacter laminarini]|uniref:Site-specific tyrosine recombinase XerD n=1 Tax=Halosquirtibacter laminarini TaxID=3374600 RepID=A0AC61NN92_9BACT|nr:site-specific tyrosine recombinase XerD [Prolixibacteraceae bacterium]
MNWDQCKKGYETYLRLEKSLSQNSVSAYMNDINKLTTFLTSEYKNITPKEVKLEHLRAFVEWMSSNNVSPRTQARTISGTKSFFKFLLMENVIEADPTTLLESPKIGRKLPDILTPDEIDQIIDAIDLKKPEGVRNKAIIEALYSCGLRVSELVNLKISNLHFEEEYIVVEGKSEKERMVPISVKAINDIKDYVEKYRVNLNVSADSEDILFLNRRGRQLSRVMIFTIIKGLADKVKLNKNISPHTFRHSFASQLIEGGADLRAVQEMLGHESILTTEIYTHLDQDYLKDTVNRHHPRS